MIHGALVAPDAVMSKLMKQRNPPESLKGEPATAQVNEYMFDTAAVRKNRDIKGNVDKVVIKNFLGKKSSRNETFSE